MAAIRIESQAFGDLRFEALARAANLTDADHAIGKMARLWRACTDRQVYVLEESVVAIVIDPATLISVGLGERVDGGIRIRGTKGRIEWLAAKRKASRKGGLANKAKWRAKVEPNGYPDGSNLESPSSSSSSLASSKENILAVNTGNQEKRQRNKKPKRDIPPDWRPSLENITTANERGIDVTAEAYRFKKFHAAKGNQFADWDAAFENWLTSPYQKTTQPMKRVRDPMLDALDRANSGQS